MAEFVTVLAFSLITGFMFFGMFYILLIVFWIYMLIDCVKSEDDNITKLMWVLILLYGSWVGAIVYYYIKKPENDRRKNIRNLDEEDIKNRNNTNERFQSMEKNGNKNYSDRGYLICPRCRKTLEFTNAPLSCPYCNIVFS